MKSQIFGSSRSLPVILLFTRCLRRLLGRLLCASVPLAVHLYSFGDTRARIAQNFAISKKQIPGSLRSLSGRVFNKVSSTDYATNCFACTNLSQYTCTASEPHFMLRPSLDWAKPRIVRAANIKLRWTEIRCRRRLHFRRARIARNFAVPNSRRFSAAYAIRRTLQFLQKRLFSALHAAFPWFYKSQAACGDLPGKTFFDLPGGAIKSPETDE